MPLFIVVFDEPAIYQADHHKARRTIHPGVVEGLRVSAPSAHHAMIHAIRVTSGVGQPVAVYDGAGQLAWGAGPEAIILPSPVPPASEVGLPDRTEVI